MIHFDSYKPAERIRIRKLYRTLRDSLNVKKTRAMVYYTIGYVDGGSPSDRLLLNRLTGR